MTDSDYMMLALELAERGRGRVHPNPMVGAVVVMDGKIIGKGYHEKYGDFHGERNAILSCHKNPAGATLYVTLEPCCHHGKTPPCTDIIIESGIRRVVIGTPDPNPLVAGKGINILKQHGIEVVSGVMEKECLRLNEVFFHFIKNRTPYVVMKYAMTMDGKTAAWTGKSRWITGEIARRRVHEDRLRYTAIMTGVGTVLSDDPLLTCRLGNSCPDNEFSECNRNPVRIICDTHLRTPLDAQVVRTATQVRTIIATGCTSTKRQLSYIKAGCEILQVPLSAQNPGAKADITNRLDLNRLMEQLGAMDIDSILLEGGGTLNWSAVSSGIVQKVQAYIAPKLLGGMGAPGPVGGAGEESPAGACLLKPVRFEQLGDDFYIESEVIRHVHRNC